MPDKLKADFDLYYKELENFTGHFKTSSQAVETDKLLSRAGKHEQVEQLKASHLKSVNDLNERFTTDFGKRLENIDRKLSGKKTDAVLNSIQKRFSKGENISSEETSRLLLHEMRETKDIMRKSSFQNVLANADEKQLRKTAQALSDGSDIEKLEWLQEIAGLKGDDLLSNSLAGQIGGIKTASLTAEQQNLKTVSEKIERGVKLFKYSIERSKTGIFIDARSEDITENEE
jgi:hypothetical protein